MRLLYKIISPILVFVLGAVVFFAFFSVRSLEQALERDAYLRISDQVMSRAQESLTEFDLALPFSPSSQERFVALSKSLATPSVARFPIWNNNQTIVFSDLRSIIGVQSPSQAEVRQALTAERPFYVIRDRDAYQPAQFDGPQFLDIYIPLRLGGSDVLVVEIHAVVNSILQPIQQESFNSMVVLTVGGLAIIVVLFIIVHIFVMRPIDRLGLAFRAFSGGNLDYPVRPAWSDELGLLSRNVDAMRINLKFLINELKEERDQSAAIVTSMGDGLIVMNRDYVVTLANAVTERLLGVEAGQMSGKKLTDIITVYRGKDILPLSEWATTRAYNTGKVTSYNLEDEVTYKTIAGKQFPISGVIAPLLRHGAVRGAVVVFRDITQEKALDEAKVGFISVASHQLRTPLTSMRWFSEMLIDGDAGAVGEQQLHFIQRIYEGTTRMINLVNLLLQTARVEAGRVKIEPVPFDLKTLTADVVSSLKTIFDEKQQRVTIAAVPEAIGKIPLDRDVIWQIVQNLLTNASRYSPPKSVIEVSIRAKGQDIEYSVKDHGIGIPKEQQDRIFEKFFRASNALKAAPEGSGLGLALVHSLVKVWGGRLWFETQEGQGATFYFTLPLLGMKPKAGDVRLVV